MFAYCREVFEVHNFNTVSSKEAFGWTQKVIDEFQVVDMPTLEKIS